MRTPQEIDALLGSSSTVDQPYKSKEQATEEVQQRSMGLRGMRSPEQIDSLLATPSAPEEKAAPTSFGGRLLEAARPESDIAVAGAKGLLAIPRSTLGVVSNTPPGMLVDYITKRLTGTTAGEQLSKADKWLEESYSTETRARQEKATTPPSRGEAENNDPSTLGYWGQGAENLATVAKQVATDPVVLGLMAVETVPQIASIISGGARAGAMKFQEVIAKNAGMEATALQKLATDAAQRASTRAVLGINTTFEAGGAMADAKSDIMTLSEKELDASPAYRKYKEQFGDTENGRMLARMRLANESGLIAGMISAPISFLSNKLTGAAKIEGAAARLAGEKVFGLGAQKVAGAVAQDVAKRGPLKTAGQFVGGVAKEGIQEAVENPGSQLGQNIAAARGRGEDITFLRAVEGLSTQAGAGLALGAAIGAPFSGMSIAQQRRDEKIGEMIKQVPTLPDDQGISTTTPTTITTVPGTDSKTGTTVSAVPSTQEGGSSVTTDTSPIRTLNMGVAGSRTLEFENPDQAALFDLGSDIRKMARKDISAKQQQAIRTVVQQKLADLSGKFPEISQDELLRAAFDYRNDVIGIAQGQPKDATFRPPAPFQVHPDVQEGINQINREFNLPEGESVLIRQVSSDPRANLFAQGIKSAVGTDAYTVMARTDKDGNLLTNKGNTIPGSIRGMRIAGKNAILITPDTTIAEVATHELVHVMETEQPDLYKALKEATLANASPEAQERFRKVLEGARMSESGKAVPEALYLSELVAQVSQEHGNDKELWNNIFAKIPDRTMATKILNFLNNLIDRILGAKQIQGPKFIEDRKKAIAFKRSLNQAFTEWAGRHDAAQKQGAGKVDVGQQAQAREAVGEENAQQAPASEGKADEEVGKGAVAAAQLARVETSTGYVNVLGPEQALRVANHYGAVAEQLVGTQEGLDQKVLEYIDFMIGKGEPRAVNTDEARNLFPGYKRFPANLAAAVHEPSSKVVKAVYAKLLREADKATDRVVFMGGGGGSGKGTLLKARPELAGPNAIVYDGVFKTLDSATSKIEQAKNAGLPVELIYVNTPADTALIGVMRRAEDTGRVVPYNFLADAHFNSSNTIREIVKHYGGEFPIRIFNNDFTKAATPGSINDVYTYELKELESRFKKFIQKATDEGYPIELAQAIWPEVVERRGRETRVGRWERGVYEVHRPGDLRRGDQGREKRVAFNAAGRAEVLEAPSPPGLPQGNRGVGYALTKAQGPAAGAGVGDADLRASRISTPPVRDDGRVELTHWSARTGIQTLDPKFYGQGLRGEEAKRKLADPENWVDRTYYGIGVGLEGGYRKEGGLGAHRYTASVPAEGLYDISKDPDKLYDRTVIGFTHPISRFEKAIRDAGYSGYWVATPLGMVAAVYAPLQVESSVPRFSRTYDDSAIDIRSSGANPAGWNMSIDEIGQHFDDQYLWHFENPGDFRNPADVDRAVAQAVREVQYQLQQVPSGLNWYEEDISKAFLVTSRFIPELSQEQHRQLFSIVAGILSPSTYADQNWEIAAQAYDHFTKTSDIPGLNPANGKFWRGGTVGPTKKLHMEMLDRMVKDKGVPDTIRWIWSNHPVSELRQARVRYGLMGPGVSGKASDLRPGFMIWGEKIGPFAMNLNGIHEVTVDRWMARTFNRYFGRMMGPDGKINDAPTEPERVVAKELANRVAETVGIKPYQVQSVLWYFEQQLFNRLGAGSRSVGFSDGAERYAGAVGGVQALRGTDADAAGPGTGTTQVPQVQGDQAPEVRLARDLNPLGFFSPLRRGIEAAKMDNVKPKVWSSWLTANAPKLGVKADELEWSGIKDYLALYPQNENLSKEAITNYLKNNGVQIKEVRLDDGPHNIGTAHESWQLEGPRQNYREILLTAPRDGFPGNPLSPPPRFGGVSQHFHGLSDIVVSLRVNDRTDADKGKVLFVEEIQSDWAQQGRKEGFKDESKWLSSQDFKMLLNKAGDIRDEIERLTGTWPSNDLAKTRIRADKFIPTAEKAEVLTLLDELDSIEKRIGEHLKQGELPEPFAFVTDTKAWLGLALKRAMILAAREGYDKVAFISGDQSNERWGLEKMVGEMAYAPDLNGGTLIIHGRDNRQLLDKDGVKPDDLPKYVGEEIAKRLLSKPQEEGAHVLKGEGDLKVGGQRMRAFYDEMVPQVLRDILKKVGGKLSSIEVEGKNDVQTSYQGPTNYTHTQLGEMVQEIRGQYDALDEDSFAAIRLQHKADAIERIQHLMLSGLSFEEAMNFGMPSQRTASYFGGSYKVNYKGAPTKQLAVEITPQMREKIADEGFSLFNRKFVDEALRDPGNDRPGLMAETTPTTLRAVGLSVLPVVMRGSTVRKIGTGKGGTRAEMSAAQIAALPQLIANPVAVFQSATRPHDSVVVILNVKLAGNNVVVAIEKDSMQRLEVKNLSTGKVTRTDALSNEINSAYPVNTVSGIASWLKEGRLRYWDKTKVATILPGLQMQFLEGERKAGRLGFTVHNPSTVGNEQSQLSRTRVDTPEFKRWFGDSKVVDANGEPLVVYHGTNRDFDAFDPFSDPATGGGRTVASLSVLTGRKPHYFSSSPDTADTYANQGRFVGPYGIRSGANILPVYLSVQNPLVIDAKGKKYGDLDNLTEKIRGAVVGGKHDGVIIKNIVDDFSSGGRPSNQYVAFSPTQIKSAIGNRGTYDESPSLIAARTFFNDRQIDWLNEQAKLAGFEGIDELAVKDFERFNTLAAEYRAAHPEEDDEPVLSDPVLASRQYGPLTPDQEAALIAIGGITTPKTVAQRFAELKEDFGGKLIQQLFDPYHAVKELDPVAYMKLRLANTADGALEAIFLYGTPFLNNGVVDVNVNDQGFAKFLASLNGEHDRYFQWEAAHRADNLKQLGLENLYTQPQIDALKKLNEGTMADGRDRTTVYNAARIRFMEFNNAVLKIANESGLIDDIAYQLYSSMPHIPFYRVVDEESRDSGWSGGMVNQRAWHKLKGGRQKLNEDLLANVMMNWSHLLEASGRNRAARDVLEAAEVFSLASPNTPPIAWKVPPNTKGAVAVQVDGVTTHYYVDDPAILQSVSAIYTGIPRWQKPMAIFKRWLTLGVTANPAFKIRNMIRDSIAAPGVASDLSINPFLNIYRAGWGDTGKSSQVYASMLAGGGLIRFGTLYDTARADRARRMIEKQGGLILGQSEWKKLAHRMEMMYDAYQDLGDRGENVNRVALYKALIAKGSTPLEANFMSRDLMDFSLQGINPIVRFLSTTVPFLNARLQGMYKLGRGGANDPKRLASVVGAVALASTVLAMLYADDDDFQKREEWDRDTYWWFKIGNTAYRIPKPFEIGAIGSVAERGVALMYDKEMTFRRFAKSIGWQLGQTFNLSVFPQVAKPLMELAANKNGFTERPIETLSMERLLPKDRITPYTSNVAKWLGQVGLPNPVSLAKWKYEALSPVQIDHLLQGYFGWLGSRSAMVVDTLTDPLLDAPEKPDRRLKDYFLIGNFAEGLPSGTSRYVTEMYDQAEEIEQAYGSFRAAIKAGDIDKATALREKYADEISRYRQVEKTKSDVSKVNARIRQIIASREMSGAEKREEIDRLEQQRQRVAERIRPKFKDGGLVNADVLSRKPVDVVDTSYLEDEKEDKEGGDSDDTAKKAAQVAKVIASIFGK